MSYLFKRDQPVTTDPSKWPQKSFKSKGCRDCGVDFEPQSPCHLYCSDTCASRGKTTAYLKRNYSITIQDYEKMLSEQEGLCAICKGTGFKMAEHHNLLLVVDHCHKTGRVRGLLCHNCNRGLGLFQDDTEFLSRAKDYLEGATTIPKGSRLK
jgi:hypothetical protein